MKRLVPSMATLVLSAVVVAACADSDPSDPNASVTRAPSTASLSSCDIAQDSVDALLPKIFTPGSQRGVSASNYAKMNKELRRGTARDSADALNYMWTLIDLSLKSYPSQITGGTASKAKVEDLVQGLLCLNGVANALDFSIDGAAAVVQRGTQQTVTTPDLFATTQLQENSLPANVPTAIVTITPINGTFPPPTGPLDTQLDQYGPFYEFHVYPATAFVEPVIVATCVNIPSGLETKVRLAHNRLPPRPSEVPGNVQFGNIEILASTEPLGLGLNCSTLPESSFLERAVDWLLPDRLYARAGSGIGGRVREYSPFGLVNTELVVSAVAGASTEGVAGAAVASPPAVRVTTAQGEVPIDGINVGFAVTQGGGSVQPSSVSTAGGIAAATTWTLGSVPGPNSLAATPAQAGLTFAPASVTFTATGTPPATPLVYGASGWKYGIYGSEGDALAGIANNGATLPNTGSAPFWSPNAGCALNAAAGGLESSSSWPSGSPTFLAVQRDFSVPSGATSVTIYLAVDNDARVFLDGNEITGSALRLIGSPLRFGALPPGDATYASGEYIIHEGCPSRWEYQVVATGLSGSVHSITAVARDRGTSTYFDASTEPPTD